MSSTSPVNHLCGTQKTAKNGIARREANAPPAALWPKSCDTDRNIWRSNPEPSLSSSTSTLSSSCSSLSGPQRETSHGCVWPPNSDAPPFKGNAQPLPPRPILSLPLVRLDPIMQAYFFRMRLLARGTCDPSHIREDVRDIASSFFDENKENTGIQSWAQRLVFAAIAQVCYTRSVAILVAELLDAFKSISERLGEDLRTALVQIVNAAFRCSWDQTELSLLDGSTGIDPINPMFELMRSHLLGIAAFSGDLYALGVLPATDMCQMASMLVYDLRTLTHTRALHLLLLRAGTGARQHLPASLLRLWRERLVCLARGWGVFFVSDVTRRWLIEICNVLDCMGCDESKAAAFSASAQHRRDVALSHKVLSSLLQNAQCGPAGWQQHPVHRNSPKEGGQGNMKRQKRAVFKDLTDIVPVATGV